MIVDFLKSVLSDAFNVVRLADLLIFKLCQLLLNNFACVSKRFQQLGEVVGNLRGHSSKGILGIIDGRCRDVLIDCRDGLVQLFGVVGFAGGASGLPSRRVKLTVQAVDVLLNGVQLLVYAACFGGCLADVSCQF
ncbi:DNA helicase, putative [Babesia ovata]|uniref:DNA helicase, putative n=1 Tax=Babesia ovata TaxID=189622 RepID=A0A2H6KK77_9APIC|nr:DNA helicase, putative [Babesia ovata]GBE63387.1 DNA helicase, putative [Babesia ovata]